MRAHRHLPLRLLVTLAILLRAVSAAQAEVSPAPEGVEPGLHLRALPLTSRSDLPLAAAQLWPGVGVTAQNLLRLRGGQPQDTELSLDGFRVTRLRVPLSAVEAVNVLTAGYGAELADVTGGVIAARLQAPRDRPLVDAELSRGLGTQVSSTPVPASTLFDAAVAGPMLPGKFGYLLAAQVEDVAHEVAPQLTGNGWDGANRQATGLLKLEFRPSQRHRLGALVLLQADRAERGVRDAASSAQPALERGGLLVGLTWRAQLPGSIRLRSQLGFERVVRDEKTEPCLDRRADCEHRLILDQELPGASPFLTGGWPWREQADQRSVQLRTQVEWDLAGAGPVQHRLRFTSRLRAEGWRSAVSVPGDAIVHFSGPIPERRDEFFTSNPDRADGQRGWALLSRASGQSLHAVEDDIRLAHTIYLVPGLGVHTAHGRSDVVRGDVVAWSPHLALAWDALADGSTWLRASAHVRLGNEMGEQLRLLRPTLYARQCRLDTADPTLRRYLCGQALPFGEPSEGACPRGNALDESGRCRGPQAFRRSREYMLGANRRLRSLDLQLDLVHRRSEVRAPVLYEVRRIDRIGALPGNLSGRPTLASPLSASSHRYTGATVAAGRSLGAMRFLAAYTVSRVEHELGPDPEDDRVHDVRAMASFELRGYASCGVVYRGSSGRPYSRWFRNPRTGRYTDLHAPLGRDPGLNPNDPGDDRELRYPRQSSLDLQLRLKLRVRPVGAVAVFVDVINLLDARSPTLLGQLDGATFGLEQAWQEPRRVRLGLSYRY